VDVPQSRPRHKRQCNISTSQRQWRLMALCALVLAVAAAILLAVLLNRDDDGEVDQSTSSSSSTLSPEDQSPVPMWPGDLTQPPSTYVVSYDIVAQHPHDPQAFTQGLAFDSAGNLYESIGLYGQSAVRRVDLETGASRAYTPNDPSIFGEGAAVFEDSLLQLSWKEGMLFEYSLPSLNLFRRVAVSVGREGWGLASDGTSLYVTDSTSTLYVVDPYTFAVVDTRIISDPELGGAPIEGTARSIAPPNGMWLVVAHPRESPRPLPSYLTHAGAHPVTPPQESMNLNSCAVSCGATCTRSISMVAALPASFASRQAPALCWDGLI